MSEAETIRFDSLDISGEVLRAGGKNGLHRYDPGAGAHHSRDDGGQRRHCHCPYGHRQNLRLGIPMLEYLQLKEDYIQELVIAPTRELAVQIAQELSALARYIPEARIATLYGGQPIAKQMQQLKRKPQIVVATPAVCWI